MHSVIQRSQIMVSHGLIMATVLTFGLVLSSCYQDPSDVNNLYAEVEVFKLRKTASPWSPDHTQVDVAQFYFSVFADFTPLFNWNVKQLFVFLVVEYSSGKDSLSRAVIWDRIIQRGNDPTIQIQKQVSKYNLWDAVGKIRSKNATASQQWNTIRYVGLFADSSFQGSTFRFPL